MEKRSVAQAITKIRVENNLSQKQFGEKLGYSQRTVSDWEKGNTEPNIETVKKIISVFDVSYEDLLGQN